MKIQTVAGTRTLSGEPPRSTAYYYADLERLKRNNGTLNGTQTDVHTDSQNGADTNPAEDTRQHPCELSEYVESNEVINNGPIREVPPLRDRQWSLPEYHTPDNIRKIEETYSTAGTFPMPEPKEKEPLLAELEIVGRLPLRQLDAASGVRRSRSWYLCCPNVEDEEISRESSWRYSSLRPVTAPPVPGQNGFSAMMLTSQSSGRGDGDDVCGVRAERDALARALAAEKQRAASAARAHDARLAELHGVIAELVRRRAADKNAGAIPEEELSDECESATQPAGELEHDADADADRSRTDQNDTSSIVSPSELPAPPARGRARGEGRRDRTPDDTTDTSSHGEVARAREDDSRQHALYSGLEGPGVEAGDVNHSDSSLHLTDRDSRHHHLLPPLGSRSMLSRSGAGTDLGNYDGSLRLSERDSAMFIAPPRPRCSSASASASAPQSGGGSCEREHGSTDADGRPYGMPTHTQLAGGGSGGGCELRVAKLASRVRLKRTERAPLDEHLDADEAWCAQAAERLALDVCAQADLREALVAANNHECAAEGCVETCVCAGGAAGGGTACACAAAACAWRARSARLAADTRVLQCALARAADTQHRLSMSCAVQESCCVSLCCALRAADRALETYDVLLALAETAHAPDSDERAAAVSVATLLLSRLEAERSAVTVTIGEPLVSPGPWLQHSSAHSATQPSLAWDAHSEERLRRHAARLKAQTVSLRERTQQPRLFSYHDAEGEEEESAAGGAASTAEMEAAVVMQEVLCAREVSAFERARAQSEARRLHGVGVETQHVLTTNTNTHSHKSESTKGRRRRERHWLETQPSETEL